ncbi:MAG: hypothetical protein KDK40_05765 [Chlamydiia bacterium]|nr:hypothetical protein [Chlamydiia bacterium]
MISEKQHQSNRQNAQLSTGPKSLEGKSVASQNALKHGLLSKDLVLKGENQEEFYLFRQAIYCALSPVGTLEELLVERVVSSSWRFQRLIRVEKELLEENDQFSILDPALSEAFCRRNGSSMQTFSRYESQIEKSFYRALHELQRLQAMKEGRVVLPPQALDAIVDGIEESGFVS